MPLWTSLRKKPIHKSPSSTHQDVLPIHSTPEARSAVSRRIHPNLNALADELERERVYTESQDPTLRQRRSNPDLHTARHSPESTLVQPLRPRPRSHSLDITSAIPMQSPTTSSPYSPRPQAFETTMQPITSSPTEMQSELPLTTPRTSATDHSRSPSTSESHASTHGNHPKRMVSFKRTPDSTISRSGSSPVPPSAWHSTFGRKSRRILPRLRSFGTTGTGGSTSPSFSSSDRGTGTPSNSIPPSPSSFSQTFGYGHRQSLDSSPPPMPMLNHPAFEANSAHAAHHDTVTSMALAPARPRSILKKRYRSLGKTGILGERTADRRGSRRKKPRKLNKEVMNKEPANAEARISHTSTLGAPFALQPVSDCISQSPITTSPAKRSSGSLDNTSPSYPTDNPGRDPNMARTSESKTKSRDARQTETRSHNNEPPMIPLLSVPPRVHHSSSYEEPRTPNGEKAKGKRKADELGVDGNTPPDAKKEKQHRASFAPDPRPHRESVASRSSYAPSSYTRKRARLSGATAISASSIAEALTAAAESSASGSREPARPPTSNMDTVASRSSASQGVRRAQSRNSNRSAAQSESKHTYRSQANSQRRHSRTPSLSQASIPLSALVSPHAPSISRSGHYHMRDPRKPPKVQPTPWIPALPDHDPEQTSLVSKLRARVRGGGQPTIDGVGWTERGGSPVHAWSFFIGFILFPLWWIASFLPIPTTRRLNTDAEHGSTEKGVVLDDPQIEHDARSWRFRCRIMSGVSLVTYIPFIVCVAIFA